MSSTPFDLLYTYQFIRRLATPFREWDAYKLGIIDENGKVLKKRSTFKTPEERNAWGLFDRLVANLKKLLGTIPLGKTRLASYAAALLLLKESNNTELEDLDDDELDKLVDEMFKEYLEELDIVEEIVNVVGAGQIAGVGVGVQGEPPKRAKAKIIKSILRRKKIV